MQSKPKILAFAGSLRKDSWNKKLVRIAVQGAKKAGGEVTLIDLKDFPMPIYDGDIETEKGLPATAIQFKKLMMEHQGLLIASPEYNSSFSGVLKNAIDWASRLASPKEKDLACFEGKVAALMSASPGRLGGLRGLVHLRSMLSNIKVLVLPDQVAIAQAHQSFDKKENLNDPKQQAAIQNLGRQLTEILIKLQRMG